MLAGRLRRREEKGYKRYNVIDKYYNEHVEQEWNRLTDNILEFETTYFHIINTINKNSRILDLGSGPGQYSFRLIKDGYNVHLADLSKENIQFAKDYAHKNKLPILGADVIDAKDLSKYENNSFDVILCLGPFYHLETYEDRIKCINELYRVVKNNGYVFCAFIMNYAPIYDFMKRVPETIIQNENQLIDWYEKSYMDHEPNTDKFYISHFTKYDEIEQLFCSKQFSKEYIFGCEGILNLRWNQIKSLDESIRRKWLEFSYKFSKTNIGISNSEHIVYVGKKER